MGKKTDKPDTGILRKKAEAFLADHSANQHLQTAEADSIKLLHELQVYQVELELQNDELQLAISAAQDAIYLYDFAPTGYFTLSREGKILNLNLVGASMLGKERLNLIKNSFDFFITNDTKPIFIFFLEKVFSNTAKETCDVILLTTNKSPMYVQLTGFVPANSNHCLITVIDITKRKKLESINLSRLNLMKFADNHTLDDLLEETLNQAEILTGSLVGFYHFVEPDQKTLWLQNWSTRTKKEFCLAEGKGSHYNLEMAGVWADCIRECRPIIHNNYSSLPNKKGLPIGHANVIRELVVPVFRSGKVVAVLGIGNKPTDYTNTDIELVSLLADLAWDITGRKRAEEDLIRNEAKFRIVADYTYDWEYWEDNDNQIIYMSPSCERISGYSLQEFLADKSLIFKIVHPADTELMLDHAKKAHTPEHMREIREIDFRIIKKDGSVAYISHLCRPIFDENNIYLGRRISNREITKRKLAEDELAKKDALLNITGSTAKVGGWEIEVETMKQTWTEEVYLIHELDSSFDPNVSKGISFYAPLSRPVIEEAIKRAIEYGEPFDLELELFTATGKHLWVHSIGKAYQENGVTKKVHGSFQDITEGKLMQEALRKSEYRLKLALKTSHTGTWDLSLTDNTSQRSLAHDQIFGYETMLPEWTYEMFLEHVLPEDRQYVDQKFQEAIATKSEWRFDCRIRRIDGEIRWIFVTGDHILDENGKSVRMSGLVQDITERKQAEIEIKIKNEELKKLNAEKDKFFSIIAHDLRSPFNGFLGLTKMMEEELSTLSTDEIQKIASSMRKSANMLFHLLENLLEWSRIQRGLISFKPVSFNLSNEIDTSIDMLRDAAEQKMIEIRCNISGNIEVIADAQMLESVVRNLVFNAIKFTPKNGLIKIDAKKIPGNLVEISIKDTGIGMDSDMVDHLFQLGEQTLRKGTEGEPSTGLGLIICNDLIEKQGGKLWIESDPGHGSTFLFTIPCCQPGSGPKVVEDG